MQPITNEPLTSEVRQVTVSIQAIQSLALRQLSEIRRLKEQRKEIREQKNNLINNDRGVSDAEYDMIDLQLKLKEEKAKVTRTPEFAKLKIQEKELGEMIGELSETLTDHLVNYSKLTNSDYIEDEEGNELKIQHKVKVVSGQLRLF